MVLSIFSRTRKASTKGEAPQRANSAPSMTANTRVGTPRGTARADSPVQAPSTPTPLPKRKSFGTLFKKDNISVDNAHITKTGLLTKQGENVKSWKKRYFKLGRDAIYYSKPEKQDKAIGLIILGPMDTVVSCTDKREFCFSVTSGQMCRTFYISASSQQEMKEWMDAIQAAIKALTPQHDSKPEPKQRQPQSSNTPTSPVEKVATAKLNDLSSEPSTPKNNASTSATPVLTKRRSIVDMVATFSKEFKEAASASPITPASQNSPMLSINDSSPHPDTDDSTDKPSLIRNVSSIDVTGEFKTDDISTMTDEVSPRGGWISPEDEFEIAICATEIFLKAPQDRTPEEHAYVYSMQQYLDQLNAHCKKTKAMPEYSLASGTVLFVKAAATRTPIEQEFVKDMTDEYLNMFDEMPKYCADRIPMDMQSQILAAAERIFTKPDSERTPDENEFIAKLEEHRRDVQYIEQKHGVKAQHSLASAMCTLTNYPENRSFEDFDLLYEMGLLEAKEL